MYITPSTIKPPDDHNRRYGRLYPLRYHPVQYRYWMSSARFNIVPAGRRSGKTELAKRKVVYAAFAPPERGGSRFPNPKYFCGAPTRDQAKRIFWKDLKLMIPPEFRLRDPSESQLIIYTITGAEIHVVGMDKPERIEGSPWDGGILDEYANMKEEAWPEHVRPALSDRYGWCDMIGVPEGRNHYYREYKKALSNDDGLRAAFHWKSSEILDPKEIEEAKRDLDELTYNQEYNASFVNFSGRAYWPYEEYRHCGRLRERYNKHHDLIFMFDFNVSPGVAVVGQELKLPTTKGDIFGTALIGEVYIPRNSNTVMVCRRLIKDWKHHKGKIYVYGDATGGAKGTAKVRGTDWEIIRDLLESAFGPDNVIFRVPRSNPRERDRVNAVNSRLLSMDGTIRLMIDPRYCPHVVEDFESVVCVEGGSGEIDKKKDPRLTHLTDSVGYYISREFPVKRVVRSSSKNKYWK